MAKFLVFGTHCFCSHGFESQEGCFFLADVTPYPADLNLLLFTLGVSVSNLSLLNKLIPIPVSCVPDHRQWLYAYTFITGVP